MEVSHMLDLVLDLSGWFVMQPEWRTSERPFLSLVGPVMLISNEKLPNKTTQF